MGEDKISRNRKRKARKGKERHGGRTWGESEVSQLWAKGRDKEADMRTRNLDFIP